jgi:hypothetical protein
VDMICESSCDASKVGTKRPQKRLQYYFHVLSEEVYSL